MLIDLINLTIGTCPDCGSVIDWQQSRAWEKQKFVSCACGKYALSEALVEALKQKSQQVESPDMVQEYDAAQAGYIPGRVNRQST